MNSRAGHHFHYSSDWPRAIFRDGFFPSPADKKFIYDRADAGKFECEGFLQDGEGCGAVSFRQLAEVFAGDEVARFERIDGDKQWGNGHPRCQSEIRQGHQS